MHDSVGVIFFQIYYRIDRDWFFYNWNRYIPPKVSFPIYNGVVFRGQFNRFESFDQFEILKNGAFKPNINISTYSRFQVNTNCFFI